MAKKIITIQRSDLRFIPDGLTVTPSSGSGNTNITTESTGGYTGRLGRTTQLTGRTLDDVATVTVNVTEEPRPLYVELTPNSTVISSEGGNAQIIGYSNAAKLKFEIISDEIGIGAISTFSAGGITATNDTAITGDPGATSRYQFIVDIAVPSQATVDLHTAVIKITPDDTDSALVNFTLNQDGAEPYLWLNEEGTSSIDITIPQSGTAPSFQILSNTNWTFES